MCRHTVPFQPLATTWYSYYILNRTNRWEKAVGDSVGVDEVIAEVETDKTSVPIPSQVAGVIEELLVEDGATVTPGKELAKVKVGAGGGAAAPAAKPAEEKVGGKNQNDQKLLEVKVSLFRMIIILQ